MSANLILQNTVQQWERRRRWGLVLETLPYAMLPGLALGTGMAIYARVRPGPSDALSLAVALGGAVLGVVVLLAWVWLRRKSPVESARWFDLNFGLKERVSTALELLDGRISADGGLTAHQVADAENVVAKVRTAALLPFRTDWRMWVVNLSLLATLAFFMLLVPPVVALDSARQRELAVIEAAVEDVRDIMEDIAADPNLSDEQRGPLLEALQSQLDTLRDPNLTLDEALATLGEAEARLSEAAQAVQTELEQQQLAEATASAALQEFAPDAEAASLQDNIEAVEGNLEDMSAEQLQQAAEALENAARALEQTNPAAAEALRDAAEALRQGDVEAAREALQQAARQAQRAETERGGQQRQQEALQRSAEQAAAAQQQAAEDASSDSQQQGEGGSGQGEASQGEAAGTSGMSPADGLNEGRGAIPALSPLDETSGNSSTNSGEAGAGGDGQGDALGDLSRDATEANQQRSDSRDEPNNPDGAGVREYQPVFAPRFSVEAEGDDELRLGADPGDAPLTQGDFQDNPLGVSLVPYNQVFSSYLDAASRALDTDYIPLGMRDVVREYFSSLDPQQAP